MIIDRNWNKKEQKLVISYIDKLGNRKFYQKYLHHIKTYEYDKDGDLKNWDGRKCKKVFKDTSTYVPNEFDILEYLYEMDPEINKALHAQYFPKLYTWDIETEVSSEFPDPDKAEQKVTAISLVGPDMSCIVYGLHKLNKEKIDRFVNRYLDWIDNNEFATNYKNSKLNGKSPKVLYQYFESEGDLIKHFFTKIMPNVPAIAGWNSYNFDWRYMVNRAEKLFGKGEMYNLIRKASPTGEISSIKYMDQSGLHFKIPSPMHVANLDYMELIKQYDYVLRPYESYSLDWVGSHAVGAHKIKYDGTLQQLYERDPEWYYFYNAVDSLIVNLIHKRLKALESPCAVDSITLVPLMASMGQIALTTANVFQTFYEDNLHVVYDYDSIERTKVNYDGAFCGCVPGKYTYSVCDDFASLYPSQIRTCNLSFENFVQNKVGPDSLGRYTIIPWTEEELEEKRKDPNYFVTLMGNVYKNDKDYAFKRMQSRLKNNRNFYKYTGQRLESELIVEIDNILNNTLDKKMEFSDDIKEIIKNHFNNADIYSMDKDSLRIFRDSVDELRDEYMLLELGAKTLMNAAYGASASPFFYFFNPALAADITGECRNLTKTMWNNLEEFFHETIWTRKDIWKEFGFELDESKHDWYRQQHVSVYSDTDSLDEKSLLLIKRNGQIIKRSFIELWRDNVEYHIPFGLGTGHQEICQSDDEVLNWTKDKGLHFVPIKYIMKHRVSKARFKIKTKSGKEVIVTGDHSCIVFRDGKQLAIKAKDINIKTDKILSVQSKKYMEYIFEEIETIEQLTDFDNENVFDIEVDDDSHTFIGNDILVHNSVYTTYGTFFDCWTPETLATVPTPMDKIKWVLNFNKKFVDKQNNKWCEEIYNPRFGQNVHEFELETISYGQICIKKKKYLKGYAFVKGKFFDKPKVVGTGIELVKSTTPKLCRTILTDLMHSLLFDYDPKNKTEYLLKFNQKLSEYRKQFYNAPIEDISQSVGIGNYKKYVINDNDNFELGKQCPVSVQAIARYNYLAHKNGEDNLKTYSGKIKYYNIAITRKLNGYFGFPAGELPSWAPPMDKLTQWKKTVIDPINRFLEVMDIPLANPSNVVQMDLFS